MMVFRLLISASRVDVLSRKTSSNISGDFCFRAQQILDRDLQREQRILQLMRQAARQFAPCRYPLGLHGAIFLLEQDLLSCD